MENNFYQLACSSPHNKISTNFYDENIKQSMTTINKIHMEDLKGLLTLKMSDFRTEDEKRSLKLISYLLDINEYFFPIARLSKSKICGFLSFICTALRRCDIKMANNKLCAVVFYVENICCLLTLLLYLLFFTSA